MRRNTLEEILSSSHLSLEIQSKFTIHSVKLNFLSIRNLTATVTEENLRETFERCTTSHTSHILMAFEVDGTVPFADSVELNE